ncbi:hypothetical protein [Microbacterium cremeum]|uniref:hypothetical protein n=1 Tax=Microbacterium cremeum TaxID=2782169 RepID=UPI00188708EF|nr:hypothetical protein [Microbacterium cremeum]
MSEQLRIWAGVTGFMAAAALVALVLFFALARPFGAEQRQWSWLGPVNDWLMVLSAGPWIVATVLVAVRAHLDGAWWILSGAVIVGIAAMAVVTLTMLAGRTGLGLQVAVTLPATVLAFTWAAVATYAAARRAVVPDGVATLALVLLIALVAGGAVVAISFLVPEGPVRTALWVLGGVPAGLAWIGYPALWLSIAATAR